MRVFASAVMVSALVAVAAAARQAPAGESGADGKLPDPPVELQQAVSVPARQLTLKIGVDRPVVAPGQPFVLVADITPQSRIHVYAPGATGYLPIELKIDSPVVTIDAPAHYPPPVRRFLPAVNESADVYEDHFQIRQPVTLSAGPPAGASSAPVTITGLLKYQACNETVCFRPEIVKFVWTVPVGP